MTLTEARDDMCTIAYNAWTGAGYAAASLLFDDRPSKIPTGNVKWARVSVRHSVGRQYGLTGQYERIGTIFIQLFEPLGSGLASLDETAQVMMAGYQGVSSPRGIWFRNVTYEEIGKDGNYTNGNVKIDFNYYER